MSNSTNKPDEEQFYQTYDWMRDIYLRKSNGKVVPISGRLLDIFAIIYGFSKSGDSCYYGSLQTIAKRLRTSTARVSADVKTLVSYGLLRKGTMQREVGWSTTYATKVYSHNVKRTDDMSKVTVFDKNKSVTKEDDTVIFHNAKNSKQAGHDYQDDKPSYQGDKHEVITVINHINSDTEHRNSKTPLSSSEVSASTPPQQAVTTPTSTNSAEKNGEVHNKMTEQHKNSTEQQSHTASSSVPVQRTVINHTVHTDSATNREEKERGHRRREKEISAHDREIVTDAYVRFYNETNAPKCKLDDALIRRCRYAVEKFGNKISEIIDKVNNSKFLQSENEFCKPDFAWVFAPGMKDKLWNCEKILNDKYRNSSKNDRGPAFKDGVKHNYGAWKK